MERRLFLAIGLSMLVVWLYSLNAPKPHPFPETTELSGNKEVTENLQDIQTLDLSETAKAPEETVKKEIAEQVDVLESDYLKIEISNIGASLKNIGIKKYDTSLPLVGINDIEEYKNIPFIVQSSEKNEITYVFDDEKIKIEKTYKVSPDDSSLESSIKIKNKTEMSRLANISIQSYLLEMSSLDKKGKDLNRVQMRDRALNEYVINSESGIHRKAKAFKFSSKENMEEKGNVFWMGFRNRYFCFLLKPEYAVKEYKINSVNETSLAINIVPEDVSIPANGNVQFDSFIYAGPEKVDILQKYGFGFEKIQKYYKFGLFDGIAKIIASLMRGLHTVIPNWGICIMLISIIIYFSMYPLTMRGMLSMRRMQTLQPQILQLKEKYKDNPQKMNKEMMELYKEHRVNPLGGCLPMLLQMPVFIGLYQVLWRSVSFKGAKFLWIKDLSQPDRLFIFPFSLPVLGNELNLLPLIMVVVMFIQQKLTAKNMVISDPNQATQQKMMTVFMPIFLGFIFYKFASGLTLYFTMFYFFSTFTQWKMSKVKKTV